MGVEILALKETIHQTYIIAFVTARICGRTDTARDVGAKARQEPMVGRFVDQRRLKRVSGITSREAQPWACDYSGRRGFRKHEGKPSGQKKVRSIVNEERLNSIHTPNAWHVYLCTY